MEWNPKMSTSSRALQFRNYLKQIAQAALLIGLPYQVGVAQEIPAQEIPASEVVVASDCEAAPQEAVSCDDYGATACDEFINCGGYSDTYCGSWWNGEDTAFRKSLAAKGITISNNLTNFYYGVAAGGREQEFRYAGHGDYLANVDFMKMGGPPGLFLKVRAEHRFGETISEPAGSILPPTILADLPTLESEEIYLTNVLFTQAFSENFAVFAGKLDTLDGDANAFAHGRGLTQFSNTAFVVTPIGLRTIAYATLGTGFVILDQGEPIFTFSVLNAKDTARSSGFDELFNEGVVLSPELRLPTNFFGLPGHQLFAGTWSSRNYVALDQDPRIVLPNVPIERAEDSWSLYWNCDQYLVVNPQNPKQGWGVFGRAGIADPSTNPIAWFASAGIGGNSKLFGREQDTFGIGYFYSGLSNQIAPLISAAVGGIGDGQGTEIFHNFNITPRLSITADGQVLLPSRPDVDYTLITGIRANLRF
jgi:porin